MNDDEKAQWNALNQERDELDATIDEIEAREARISHLANKPEHTEGIAEGFNAPSARSVRGGDIYDLTTIRRESTEAMCRDLRDRAMRSVEGAKFPPHVQRESAQAHIESLIGRFDNPEREDGVPGEISRRILATGSPIYKRAFTKTMGSKGLTADEQRALSVGTGSAGGFAIVYTLDPTIIPTSNLSVNPYRAFCSVEQIAGTNEWRGVTSGGITAAYADEGAAATDQSPTLAQPDLTVAKAHTFVPASIEVTQDWSSIESDLSRMIVDAKDDLEATKFTTGTYAAASMPGGLQAGLTTTQKVTTAGTAAFVLADLYKLWEALPPRFRARASWIGNLFAYDKVRQFDTAGGAGLWLQNLTVPSGADAGSSGQVASSSLLGKPAYESTAMTGALTSGTTLFIVGDGRYYKIIDRIGLDIEVIPHLFDTSSGYPTGTRGFYAYWRNTAKVLDPNGFRYLATA